MRDFENAFETALFGARFLIMVAVLASLAAGAAMLYLAAVDTVLLVGHSLHYGAPSLAAEARAAMRLTAITHVVEIVDGFLLAGFLLIFGLGLYELFIHKLEVAEGSAFSRSILHVRSLDDLKGKLAKVVLIMLVVKFFEQASSIRAATPLELLWAAGGVALIGLALFLAHAAERKPEGP